MIKISPMRVGGEIGEKFLLVKFSMYVYGVNSQYLAGILILSWGGGGGEGHTDRYLNRFLR